MAAVEKARDTEHPLAYVRRIIANMAASRIRRPMRERRGIVPLDATATDRAAITDMRAALQRIPARRRASAGTTRAACSASRRGTTPPCG
jgi:DNA-directed RNA polymerase specialized sigma24 family protein